MNNIRQHLRAQRAQIPPWKMPADPVKAVKWFFHWLLTVLVAFFWVPILGMVIYQAVINWNVSGPLAALWSGLITLLVGLIVWAVLRAVLGIVNFAMGISRVVSDVKDFQRTFVYPPQMHPLREDFQQPSSASPPSSSSSKVIEGTIIEIKEEPQTQRPQNGKWH